MGFSLTRWFSGRGADTRREGLQTHTSRPSNTPNVNFDSAMSVSAFWASVRLITETVSAMPLNCYERSPDSNVKKRIADNNLWRLLNYKPNRFHTRTEFFEQILLSLCTYGNAYVAIERASFGVVSLLPLPPAQVAVRLVGGERVYEYTTEKGDLKVFAQKSIWHVMLFGNGVQGLSPLSNAARALNISIQAENRVNKLANTGGKATGILTIDKILSEEQRKSVQANFKELEEGDSEELFVLEAGMDYKQTSLSPSDMQLLENRRFQIEDIARFMGVPSVLINDTAATTTWGSGIEQITQGFYKLNLRPYLERIESSIKRHLIDEPEWETIDIEFDFDSLLRADKATRMEAANKGINSGVITPNEARADEGLGPKDGGDNIYLNSTLLPAEQQQRGMNNGTQTTEPEPDGV